MFKIVIKSISNTLIAMLCTGVFAAGHVAERCTPTASNQQHGISPLVYQLAQTAYQCALKKGVGVKKPLITIIDFTRPSTEKRLWIVNLKTHKILISAHVAHGKNSGSLYSSHFSNIPGSDETSLGLYLTQKTFTGNDGYSLRLIGLDKGFNDQAYHRLIVFHGAWYVSPSFMKKYHRIGRSWGCFALNKDEIKPVINLIKNDTLVLAYSANKAWLSQSKYLNCKLPRQELNKILKSSPPR